MDLIKFKERYPIFLNRMKEAGYYSGYIEKYERMVRLILEEGTDESIGTYEQFYNYMVERHKYTECTNYEYRNQIGRLKAFVEDGIFLGDTGKSSGFIRYKSYDCLSLDFKYLIDSYVDIERKQEKRSESTINYIVSHTSSFLYCIQQAGITTLSGIKNTQTVFQAFDRNQRRNGSYTVVKSISTVLKACMHLYPSGDCLRIWGMLPEFPRHTRLCDNLQPEENKKIAAVLDDEEGNLTYRNKAIGKLAYYTGMRRIDIANLHFENISFEKEEITFIQQKTGLEICMPLRSVVGNAIYDYIIKERPKCASDNIFITAVTPFIKLSPTGVSNDSVRIYKEAGLRQEKGRRKGFHLFRHAFASDLIARDIPSNTVSELLGHASPASLNPYLDADQEHLRACALSINRFAEIANAYIEPFGSAVQAIIRNFVDYCIEKGIWCSDYNRALRSFDNYCVAYHPDLSSITGEVLNQWCKPMAEESRKAYLKRIGAFSDFISYLSAAYAFAIVMPKPENVDRRRKASLMKEYTSPGAGLFNQFVNHRKASGRWSDAYDWSLRSFDMHCATRYPKATALTQEMVDTWCTKRQSENPHSCGKRIAAVNSFLKYACERQLLNLEWHSIPTHGPGKKSIKVPHVFTEVELRNFFYACDQIQISRNSLVDRLMKLTIPVFFRLLFSTGMRTNEARNMNVEDVDLKHGIINIRHTKGYIEHRAALHPTMKERLVEYNDTVSGLMPDRKCFFPDYYDKYYSLTWMEYNFERLWFKYNHSHATVYHLRHHFATTNINNWPSQAEKFNRNLVYLSRSMGHSTVETTMYYYSFTPKLAEILKERKNETFNEIIPNRYQYFTNDED
jgi:integrase